MEQKNNQEDLLKQIQQLEALARPLLSRQALQRLGNVKIAHPELYVQACAVVAQYGKEVSDDQLKEILIKLSPKKQFNMRK